MTRHKHYSNLRLQFVVLLAFATAALGTCDSLHAGKITGWNWTSGVASLALTGVPPLADPNNDDVSGPSPNQLTITQKDYFAIGPVDIVFDVMDSGGVTEYTLNEGVFNNTGLPWSAYRIELGFGVGAGFTSSPSGDGLDFDATDFNSPPDFSGSGFFTTVSESEDALEASGGIFPLFGFPTPLYRFNFDVPDGITTFTIRQQPVGVPEPAAFALAALAGSLICVRRRVPLDKRKPLSLADNREVTVL